MKNSTTLLTFVTAMFLNVQVFSAPITQYLKIVVTYNSNLAEQQPTSMVLSFSSIGTDGLDSYDMGNQNSLGSLNEAVNPFTLTSNNYVITQQDARPDLDSYKRIQFGFATKFPSKIKLIASAFGNSSDSTNRPTYAWIEQISTGLKYSLLNDTVTLDIPANLNFQSDFYLHVGPQITKTKIDETCFNSFNGSIEMNNPNMHNWNLTVYKNSSLSFSTQVNQPDTTIANLNSGNYTVVTSINSIAVDSTFIFVNGASQIVPAFTADNHSVSINEFVNFTNASSGASSYFWDFGDGNSDTLENTSHQYLADGNYKVVLKAVNELGCEETVFDSIVVSTNHNQMHQAPNFISNLSDPNLDSGSGTFAKPFNPSVSCPVDAQRISISHDDEQVITVRVMDMGGRLINNVTSTNPLIELSVPQAGIYIVQMIAATGEMKSKTILVGN